MGNKLDGTYVYRHKHNYIPYNTFTITKVQLHVSAINVGHLQVYIRNLSISYTNMCGDFTFCGVGVRDLVLCWRKGVWTGAVLGIVLKYHSCLLTAMSISGLHF